MDAIFITHERRICPLPFNGNATRHCSPITLTTNVRLVVVCLMTTDGYQSALFSLSWTLFLSHTKDVSVHYLSMVTPHVTARHCTKPVNDNARGNARGNAHATFTGLLLLYGLPLAVFFLELSASISVRSKWS